MRLALFQPDIAPNLGAAIRLCACLNIGLDVIEPCGFPISDKTLKRAALDYEVHCDLQRHNSFAAFLAVIKAQDRRLIGVETGGSIAPVEFVFQPNDVLMLGRETAGTPFDVLAHCDGVVTIPMARGIRSLNVVTAGTIALSEAIRQTGGWLKLKTEERPST